MKGLVLAAGYATRLYPLTKNTPKPLSKVAGKTILDYIVEKMDQVEAIDEIIIVTNDKFTSHFEEWVAQADYSKKLTVVNDGTTTNNNRLGAIGDIQFVIDKLDLEDDLMVLAGDNLFDFELTDFANYFQEVDTDVITTYQEEYVFGKNTNNVTIINNAIETENFIFNENIRRTKRKELGLQNEVVVGHVGRFVTTKNHTYIIDVFNEYQKLNSNSILLLIGSGELQDKIMEKAEKLNLVPKIKFLGDRSDVHELLQAFDIFIFPSIYEGLPVTLVEAQASGLPIIASDSITKEVKITNLVNFRSIHEEPIKWAQTIKNLIPYTRENKSHDIIASGFDIEKTAFKLQKYYLNIVK